MASIVTRTREDGKRSYHVKYRAGDGRVRWEHVPGDKRAANARKREIENELHRNTLWTPPKPVKFDDAVDHWLAVIKHEVGARTYENHDRAFRLVWRPAFGKLELAAISY